MFHVWQLIFVVFCMHACSDASRGKVKMKTAEQKERKEKKRKSRGNKEREQNTQK